MGDAVAATATVPVAQTASPKRLNFLERHLSIGVLILTVVGVALGRALPDTVGALRKLQFGQGSQVNIPITVFLGLMSYPMMLKLDSGSLVGVPKPPRARYQRGISAWAGTERLCFRRNHLRRVHKTRRIGATVPGAGVSAEAWPPATSRVGTPGSNLQRMERTGARRGCSAGLVRGSPGAALPSGVEPTNERPAAHGASPAPPLRRRLRLRSLAFQPRWLPSAAVAGGGRALLAPHRCENRWADLRNGSAAAGDVGARAAARAGQRRLGRARAHHGGRPAPPSAMGGAQPGGGCGAGVCKVRLVSGGEGGLRGTSPINARSLPQAGPLGGDADVGEDGPVGAEAVAVAGEAAERAACELQGEGAVAFLPAAEQEVGAELILGEGNGVSGVGLDQLAHVVDVFVLGGLAVVFELDKSGELCEGRERLSDLRVASVPPDAGTRSPPDEANVCHPNPCLQQTLPPAARSAAQRRGSSCRYDRAAD